MQTAKMDFWRRALCALLSIVLAAGLAPGAALAEAGEAAQAQEAAGQGEAAAEDPETDGAGESPDDSADDAGSGSASASDSADPEPGEAAASALSEDEAPADAETLSALSEDAEASDAGEALSAQATASANARISGTAHLQNVGDKSYSAVAAGKTLSLGTIGQSRRLEAFSLKLSGVSGSIAYSAHVQDVGWQASRSNGALAGTTGRSKRVEAVKISLSGEAAQLYDVYYRVHSQDYGWLGWAKNGEAAGTQGLSKRAECVQVVLVAKGGSAPGDTSGCFVCTWLSGTAHVQDYGNRSATTTSASATLTLGTTGKSKRLEGVKLSVSSDATGLSGSIQYQAHVQNVGWQGWRSDGALAGTTGQSKRVEAVQIKLTGELEKSYDVYYRVHVANIGWMGWAKNGESAGTSSASILVEAVQVRLVKKGAAAPGSTSMAYIDGSSIAATGTFYACSGGTWVSAGLGGTAGTTGKSTAMTGVKATLSNSYGLSGSIQYRAHVADAGWLSWSSAGTASQSGSRAVQAIQVKLTGDLSKYFDVYYRVHVANYGWMGWAKNGASAGTTGLSMNAEAYQVKLVPKGGAAPGSTAKSFSDENGFLRVISGDTTLDNYLKAIYASKGKNLYTLFTYVAGYSYRSGSEYPSGNWSISFAKEMYERGSGNCYRFAALFCWLAKGLGYDANVVSGSVPTASGGRAAHGWVEIHINGTTYICDPDMHNALPSYNWYMVTYSNAPITYCK